MVKIAINQSVELGSIATPADEPHDPTPSITDSTSILTASNIAEAQVPDGGYGWVVVTSCAILTFWFVGTSYTWGVVQAALVESGISSVSTLSFVGSLTVACISIFAIANARIVRRFGARNTALAGVVLLGGGEILSGFSAEGRSVGGLFVTAGVIMGVGTSLCFMVVSATPAQYFMKKRGLANGIVFAGGGLGGTVLSFAIDGLVKRLGVPWAFRVLGFITLATGLPAAWVIKERVPISSVIIIDWRLFKDPRFSVLFVAGAIATFPLFVPPFFLPLYTKSLGLSSSFGAGAVAAFNFSSAVGRLLCGFGADLIGPINTLLLSLVLSSISMLVIWPLSTSVGPLIAFVIINGAANGGFFAVMPTVVGNTFSSAKVAVAMGMIVTGWAGGYLLGAPIAGYILNASGGAATANLEVYHPAIFYAGSMATGAAVLVAFVRFKTDKNPRKRC